MVAEAKTALRSSPDDQRAVGIKGASVGSASVGLTVSGGRLEHGTPSGGHSQLPRPQENGSTVPANNSLPVTSSVTVVPSSRGVRSQAVIQTELVDKAASGPVGPSLPSLGLTTSRPMESPKALLVSPLVGSSTASYGATVPSSDADHIYDTPPVNGSNVKPLFVNEFASNAGKGCSYVAMAQEERIYDDPATFVVVAPPVPSRQRTQTAHDATAGSASRQPVQAVVPSRQTAVTPSSVSRAVVDSKTGVGRENGLRHDGRAPHETTERTVTGEGRSTAKLLQAAPRSNGTPIGSTEEDETVAELRAQLQTLNKCREEAIETLSRLKHLIADAEAEQEATVNRFETERLHLETEQREDLENLHTNVAANSRQRAAQVAILERISREQEEEAAKIERARMRMAEAEQERHTLLQQSVRAGADNSPGSMATESSQSDLEQLDNELKDFEDLEFQQLEVETKFEEEREEAQHELSRHQMALRESIGNAEARLESSARHQRELLQKAKQDADVSERRRLGLVADFRAHKDRLLAIDRRARELEVMVAQMRGNARDATAATAQTRALEDDLMWSSPGEAVNKALGARLRTGDASLEEARRKLEEIKRAAMTTSEVPASLRTASTATVQRWPSNEEGVPEQRIVRGIVGRTDSEESSLKSSGAFSDADKLSFSGSEDIDRFAELQKLLAQARAHVQNVDTGGMMPYVDIGSVRSPSRPQPTKVAMADDEEIHLRERTRAAQDRPLTRYLPARTELFDLRLHVESAGHNIDACPFVEVDPKMCRGYLLKMGGKRKSWNKRWFVFNREKKVLAYFADKNDTKPRGSIHFQTIEDVFVDHLKTIKSPHHKLTFCVKTFERPYYLIAKTPETMSIWIDVIFSGAEGYQEF